MKEIWKDVVGYEGRYMVSNLGNVINTQTNRPLGKGRSTITLYNADGIASGKTRAAIIAEAFLEKPQTTEDLWAVIIDKDKPTTLDNVKWRYRESESPFPLGIINIVFVKFNTIVKYHYLISHNV